ncbi:MAG TPA: DUF3168 domain-containing protein [Acidobacteriaceae bacterium]|nr:DUF3168 domain-containing protein [Acidobacteriaceae bacterium]
MLTSALYSLLTSSATFTNIAGTNLYALLLPNTLPLPSATYQIIGSTSQPTFTGSGIQRTRVQFDCFGSRYQDATNLRGAIVSVLNGYQGTVGGVNISAIGKISHSDFFEHDDLLYRCMVEFYVFSDLA